MLDNGKRGKRGALTTQAGIAGSSVVRADRSPHSSTAAAIHRPTQLQLVSRSQAHLANVLDNGRSGKGCTDSHLPPYQTTARIAIASASGEHVR
jgi:hypothetical protein